MPLRIQVLTNNVEIRHLSGQHAMKGGANTDSGAEVRIPHRFVGYLLIGELKCLLDIHDVVK